MKARKGARKPARPRKKREAKPPSGGEGALARRAGAASDEALAALGSLETLEGAYDAWTQLRLEHAGFLARLAEERRKLDQQGSFLVGAVREAAAVPASGAALARARGRERGLEAFLGEAERKLEEARAALAQQAKEAEAKYGQAFARVRAAVLERVKRYLPKAPPKLQLWLRPAGPGKNVLHLERVSPDESVLLCYALSGRVPSRHGFLFDDSTDDVALAPQPLYGEEGVAPSETRPEPSALRAKLGSLPEVWPIKGFIPVFVGPKGDRLFRLLERGPVMEVELLEGNGFRNLLTHEEGQRFAGHLLRLKMEGRLDLEVRAG